MDGGYLFSWLKVWKVKIVAFATTLGGPGLLLISFLDSSVLTFPIINDLLLINLSIQQPARHAAVCVSCGVGSVAGCVVLYFVAKRVGKRSSTGKPERGRARFGPGWKKNGFGGMLIAALLPPPTPFKVFVFGAGVFEVPLLSFTTAIALARCIRYSASVIWRCDTEKRRFLSSAITGLALLWRWCCLWRRAMGRRG